MLGIVPARGGSKRLPRKNLQLVDGKPLVLIAAEKLAQVCDRVVVSTDDDEIESVARSHGYQVHRRPTVSDEQTIVEAVNLICDDLDWTGAVLLLQPTVPNVTVHDLSLLSGILNLTEKTTPPGAVKGHADDIPTGVYGWTGPPYAEPTIPMGMDSAWPDIDTVDGLHAARLKAQRKRIDIVYLDDPKHGTGHRHRAETLAAALAHHDVDVVSAPIVWREDLDLLITDMLDSERPTYGKHWVTFENRHSDTVYADLTINALYGREGWAHERTGPNWAILRPEFQALPAFEISEQSGPERVLVMFGGTDPANLHDLAKTASNGLWTFVEPGETVPVAATMREHDILVTSAGRTVFEAAAVGIPTVVLAQNNREATHTHLGPEHGNIYLGLGRLVTADKLRRTVELLGADFALRSELSLTARRSIDGKGLQRIVWAIDGILEEL